MAATRVLAFALLAALPLLAAAQAAPGDAAKVIFRALPAAVW